MNQVCRAACSVILLILFFCAYPVFAQEDPRLWGEDGVALRNGTHLQWDGASAMNDDGYMCVVWADARTGPRNIYAQLVDPQGNPVWDTQCVPVCAQSTWQHYAEVVAVDDGFVIAWIDLRYESFDYYLIQNKAVYTQKLDMDGNTVWNSDGLEVYYEQETFIRDSSIRMAHGPDDGVIISWIAGSQIVSQRIGSSGTFLWHETLRTTNLNIRHLLTSVTDESGNMLLAWDNGSDSNRIRAAKIMTNGSLPWGGGVSINANSNMWHIGLTSCKDFASDGFYLAWRSDRNPDSDALYLQRVDSEGNSLWEDGGVFLSDMESITVFPSITHSINQEGVQDGIICSWLGRTEDDWGTISQKVSEFGVFEWETNGVNVCGNQASSAWYYPTVACSDYQGGAAFLWAEGITGTASSIFQASRLDETGTPVWQDCAVDVHPVPYPGLYGFSMEYDHTNSTFRTVFTDVLSISCQSVDASTGSLQLPASVPLLDMLSGNTRDARVVSIAEGYSAIVWDDERNNGCAICYQIIDSMAQPYTEPNGVLLTPPILEGPNQQRLRGACSDENGGFFALYEERYDERYDEPGDFRIAHVNSLGIPICNRPANDGSSASSYFTAVKNHIVSDGMGGCYISWTNPDQDVILVHLNSECEAAWDEPLFLSDIESDYLADIVAVPEGGCVLIWEASSYLGHDLYATRVNQSRQVEWTVQVVDSVHTGDMKAVSDENGGAFIMWSHRLENSNSSEVKVQWVNSEGVEAWTPDGILVYTGEVRDIELIYQSDHALFVTWYDENGEGTIRAQKLTPEGLPLWRPQGLTVAMAGSAYSYTVTGKEGGGLFFSWEENQNTLMGMDLQLDGTPSQPWWIEGAGGPISEGYTRKWPGFATSMSSNKLLVVWNDGIMLDDLHTSELLMQLIETVHVSEADPQIILSPEQFTLHQNYPNPFNPSTTISFAIPKAGQTSLVVYDLLGRTVETLMNKPLAAGSYHVSWNASALPSGVYFYRLTAGEFSDVKKTVLLK